MKDQRDKKVIPFPAGLLTGALVLTGVVLVATVWLDKKRSRQTGQA